MKNFPFRYHDIPYQWAVCFNSQCPLREKCMRWQAAELIRCMPVASVQTAMCVTPQVWQSSPCSMFVETKTELRAWGFSTIFDHVSMADYPLIKASMMSFLRGQSNYYRYRNGELKLSERQQHTIDGFFAKYGYPTPVTYDHYECVPVFS